MGRLIDADALMEYFKRLSDECSSENNYEYSNLYDCVCAEIMTQPTAYDKEKVVAELEERKGNVIIDGKIMYQENYFIDIDSAIDIVKAGDVDD